jgi:hypothetical protein
VPVLYEGPAVILDSWGGERHRCMVSEVLDTLRISGSQAAPGFMDPEGVIVFHTASRTLYKKTIKDDEVPKSVVNPTNGT